MKKPKMNNIYCKRIANCVGVLAGSSILLVITTCATLVQNPQVQRRSVERAENESLTTKSEALVAPLITVKDAKIYAWWWEESVVRAGFDGDKRPPKTRYVEITKWEYDGDGITTYPHQVDFISNIANNSSDKFEGMVTFKLALRFEDERLYSRDPVDGTIEFHNDVFESIPWMGEFVILDKKITIEGLREEKAEAKQYDLKKLLNRKKNGKSLCALRFIVQMTDMSGKQIDSNEKIIQVLLGD